MESPEESAFALLRDRLNELVLSPLETNEAGEPAFESLSQSIVQVPIDLEGDRTVRLDAAIVTRPYRDRLKVLLQAARQRHSQVRVNLNGHEVSVQVTFYLHMVMHPSWVIRVPTKQSHAGGALSSTPRYRLLLKKGFYFDSTGSHHLIDYGESPLPIHHFANLLTLGDAEVDGPTREQCLELERCLDMPQSSSSPRLENFVCDKLLTRLVGALADISVPASLGLIMPGHLRSREIKRLSDEVGVAGGGVCAIDMPQTPNGIRMVLENFLKTYRGEKVVVKGSGPQFTHSIKIRRFKRDQFEQIVEHILKLSAGVEMRFESGSILVDACISGPAVCADFSDSEGARYGLQKGKVVRLDYFSRAECQEKKSKRYRFGVNFRVYSNRTPNGAAEALIGIVRIEGDSVILVPIEHWREAMVEQHDIPIEELNRLSQKLVNMGREFLSAIRSYEQLLPRVEGGPLQDETETIGLDVLLEKRSDGDIVPICIEVNDMSAAGQYAWDKFYENTQRVGEHSRMRIATTIGRSLEYALARKGATICWDDL